MIAAWMLYSTVFGALIALATLLAEGIARSLGAPTRRVWSAGLLGAALLPALAVLVKDAPPAVEVAGVVVPTTATSGFVMESVVSWGSLDLVLGVAWLTASATLGLLLVGGIGLTLRQRRRWVPTLVDRVPVLLSDDVGPAVVGFLPGSIVLPKWALAVDTAERSMMLRHEQEHLAAGDQRLTLLAALLVVAMPWNVAIWLLARRVRLAVEIDCDRRVMSAGDLDMRSYAELLLRVGARRTIPAYAVGFSVGRPFLEHRIDRMTGGEGRARRSASVLGLLGIGLVLGVAWDLPQPVRAADVASTPEWCIYDTSEVSQRLIDGLEWST